MRAQVTASLLVASLVPLSLGCGDDGGASSGGTAAATGSTGGSIPSASTGEATTDPVPTVAESTDGGSTGSADSGSSGGESSGGDESSGGMWMPSVDCDMIPGAPIQSPIVQIPSQVSEDFTFDAEGNMIGVVIETQGLHRTTYEGVSTMIVPDVSDWGRGVRVLDNGDYLVVVPGEGLDRVTPQGGRVRVMNLSDEANGLALHPNGMAYLTSGNGQLRSLDPDTGDVAVLDQEESLDGIAFNVDYTKLYYNSESGLIKQLAFVDGVPTGEPSEFVTLQPNFILDGMAVDECDNLYAVDMFGVIWRISAEGEVEAVITLEAVELYSAINFGSGIGGWKADHLYIMSLGQTGVLEVEMGVQGKPVPHLP